MQIFVFRVYNYENGTNKKFFFLEETTMFVNMFSRIKIALPVTFERERNKVLKGYRNKIEKQIAAGVIPTAGSDTDVFRIQTFISLRCPILKSVAFTTKCESMILSSMIRVSQ
jgi:polyphosphate kinase